MKFAWIENERIRDICLGDPATLYHSDVAALYTEEVPDISVNGDGWVNGQLVKPEIANSPIPETVYAKVSAVEFMLLFTSAERVAMKSARSTDPVIDDWMDIVQDPRLTEVDLGLQSTKNALDYLVSVAVLTPERKKEILAGEMQ